LEIIGLEDEIDVASKGNTLSCGQSKQVVVVEDTIKGFDPFRINISVTNDPIQHILLLFDYLSS
jgi:hypothetical protein